MRRDDAKTFAFYSRRLCVCASARVSADFKDSMDEGEASRETAASDCVVQPMSRGRCIEWIDWRYKKYDIGVIEP